MGLQDRGWVELTPPCCLQMTTLARSCSRRRRTATSDKAVHRLGRTPESKCDSLEHFPVPEPWVAVDGQSTPRAEKWPWRRCCVLGCLTHAVGLDHRLGMVVGREAHGVGEV